MSQESGIRTGLEYLVSYGQSGDFSRFRSVEPFPYQRGDRVVVRSHQGLELGVIMCPVSTAHTHYLSDRTLGELLRPLAEEDEHAVDRLQRRSQRIFEDGRRLVGELGLPLEILDVEILFDGRQAIIHHLRPENVDCGSLVSALARKHDLLFIMHNLVLPAEVAETEGHGCGKPGCGQEGGGGGCSSCGSGGGCSTGSCGAGVKVDQVTAYLAGLRQKMEAGPRTPLL